MLIKDLETNDAFLKVISLLMDEDPDPASKQGITLAYLVREVAQFEDKHFPIGNNN